MTDTPFDAQLSVNTIISRFPESLAAFNALGVDTCCGGASSLADAARDAGISLDDLVAAVEGAIFGDGAAA
jgi:regulator of cell morphogenesis and NO signaling